MQSSQLISFVLVSALFILAPGPNVIVIVSTSLRAGYKRGLQTVLGTNLAMLIQLLVAAVGTSWLLALLTDGLLWLKWAGVLYLLYLGCRALLRCWQVQEADAVTALGSMQRGFWIALTNPKTILFFSAFLPQFVTDASRYNEQVALLSVIFWLLATSLDACYAIAADRLRWLLGNQGKGISTRAVNGTSGTLYLTASALLAGSNRAP